MHAYVVLRAPDGRVAELVNGDLVGRMYAAALQLDDPRVSEAHAMVSLREGELQLLPLRGALAVGGEPVPHVALRAGLDVELAPGVAVRVVEAHLPDAVLGVEGDGLPRQMLPPVASLLTQPRLRLATGWRAEAAAQIWTNGDQFRIRVGEGEARPVDAGDSVDLAGRSLRFVAIPLASAGLHTTRRQGDFDSPLHIIAHYDSLHIHRDGSAPLVFGGMQARLLSELVALDGPVAWTALTEELWPDEDDVSLRRGRLDTLLSRIRRRLRAAGVRADLVRTDGAGTVELVRYPRDRVEDQT